MSVAMMTKEQWLEKKDQYKHRLTTIIIPLDITPGVMKGLLSRIDNFFSEIRLEFGELEGRKEEVDSIIREWERVKAVGSSDTARKKAASESIQAYPVDGISTINLYDVQRSIYERYAYMRSVIDILEAKQSRLITASGLLKVESGLSPHASIT